MNRNFGNPIVIVLLFLSILLPIVPSYAFQTSKGVIKGVITTAEGKPAGQVSVALLRSNRRTATAEDGSFILRDIAAGHYNIQVTLLGYTPQTQAVTVAAGSTVTIDIRLDVSDQQLQEVIVSSSRNKFKTSGSRDVAKLPLANMENPQVYNTVNKQLLLEQGVFTADDAVKNVPGITTLWNANGRAGDGGAYYSMRGFTTSAQLRNGMAGTVTSTVDAINLERMEVIKGPSATLYGSTLTSYGGLINRVTKKPYDHLGGEISYTGGSYDFNRVSADLNTPLDKGGKALLRINTAFNSMGSFQDNGFSRNFAFDPSFTYKVNDRMTLNFEAEINHRKGTTPAQYFFNTTIPDLGVDRADQLSADYKKSYQAGDIVQVSDNTNFYGNMEYKISDQWKSQTNFSTTSGSSEGALPYLYLIPGNDSINRMIWTLDGNTNKLQIQQNFTGDFHIGRFRNRLVAGLDYLHQYSNIRYIDPNDGSDFFDAINTRGPNLNYYNFDKAHVDNLYQSKNKSVTYTKSIYNIYSVYVSDVFNIRENLMVMASARIDHFNSMPINDPVTDTSTRRVNQTSFSPKLGIVYQVIKDKVALFGNYMNGFTNPGYYLSYNSSSKTNESVLFKQEQANQWEGGVKLDLLDGRLSGVFSYYDIHVKNKVRADADHPNASVQDGTQYSKGFEAAVTANPFTGFNIVAGYAYNDSKMEKSRPYDNGRRPQVAGPANTANLWLSYTLSQTAAKGLGVGVGGNYAGDNKVMNNAVNGVFSLPAYTVINATAYYNQPKYRVAINVNNLTNQEYWIGYTTVDPQMLRQVLGTVSYKF